MINVSEEFRQLMRERTDFKAQAQITLADGREITVTEDVFASSGVTLTDGAGASGLPLGAAVCRTVQLELVNADGWLDEYDFFGARVRLWLTFALSETVERVQLGTFTVTEPETWGETVTITAADDMIRADKTYVPGPAGETTLGQLWRDVCSQCGIAFSGEAFPNSDMTVTAPAEECTCRQMLGWIALLAGGNARVDRQGTARVLSYDGGRGADHELTDWSALSTDTDDVLITGVEMQTDAGTVLEGEEGYVLTVEDPLAEGREEEALRRLGDALIGLRLRRFQGRYVGYPLAECMDTVRFRDRRGRWYSSVITDVTFTCGACTEISNSAEGVVRNGSRYVSAETRARQAAGKLFLRERTAREALAEQLQKQLAEASGFYTTDVEQPDGSIIRYTHDKPTLAASKNVIKVTGEAIGFSTDGGKSYPFGVSVDGKTIMDIVASKGVIADWITAGILQSQDGKTFFCDLVKGVLKMNATELTIQGKSVGEALSGAVTNVENQFYLSDSPTELSGGKWEAKQPAWTPGKYIWSRQYVTYGDGTDAYLPDEGGVCITGNTGASGANGTNGTNGVGIESVEAQYILSPSDVSPEEDPSAHWGTEIPQPVDGLYIWTRQKITYTDGNVEYAGQYCMSKTMGDIAKQAVDTQTAMDILNKLTDNGRRKGIFMQDDELYVSASAVLTGVLDAMKIAIAGEYGSILQGEGAKVVNGQTIPTTGMVLYGPLGDKGPLFIVTNAGARMSEKEGGAGVYAGDGFVTVQNAPLRVPGSIGMSAEKTTDYTQVLRILINEFFGKKILEVGNGDILETDIYASDWISLAAKEIKIQGAIKGGINLVFNNYTTDATWDDYNGAYLICCVTEQGALVTILVPSGILSSFPGIIKLNSGSEVVTMSIAKYDGVSGAPNYIQVNNMSGGSIRAVYGIL